MDFSEVRRGAVAPRLLSPRVSFVPVTLCRANQMMSLRDNPRRPATTRDNRSIGPTAPRHQ
ncbi:MAG: hypothetical protein K2I91_02105, partial [Muribaculaceae bacterium]|nr:hypothetical protein [Muribaculaceae bacterium]